ncbi:MAG: toxin-antitoxin system YwqK family antitoxin [Chlamydiota bacterium]
MTIVDADLGIEISEAFSPRRLPEDFVGGEELGDGTVIVALLEGEEYVVQKEGCFHGEYRLYYPQGTIKATQYYCYDHLHGPSIFYGVDGEVLSHSWFVNGVRQGKVWQYYPSGALYCRQGYRDGELEGLQEYYYSDGTSKTIMHYHQGLLDGDTTLFDQHGVIKKAVVFDHGQKVRGKD